MNAQAKIYTFEFFKIELSNMRIRVAALGLNKMLIHGTVHILNLKRYARLQNCVWSLTGTVTYRLFIHYWTRFHLLRVSRSQALELIKTILVW